MIIKDHFLTQEEFTLEETAIAGIYITSPIPKDLDRYYESTAYISHYQDKPTAKEKFYKFLQGFNLNFKRNIIAKELHRNANILDYGCGAGEFLKFIEEDFTTFGYEPNLSARAFAANKSVKTRIIDHIDSVPDHSLDAITLWHVLEHIENQKVLLEIFYKKLKPKGLLVIAVPNHTSYDAEKYREFWAAYDVPRHVYHFSKKGMEKLMNNEQWNIKYIKPLLLDAFYISMLSEKYKKSPLFWLKGFIFGAISNFKAVKTGEFSSLIYVIEKK